MMRADVGVGTVLGEFETVLDRSSVWRVDWAVGLDQPEYQDPDVAQAYGMPNLPVPPGGLVFFTFLEGLDWAERIGLSFDRSLATRRRLRLHRPLYVGDHIRGSSTVTDVATRAGRGGGEMEFVTITTVYRRNDETVLEEAVTYATRGGVR
jgi:hypothetical protein